MSDSTSRALPRPALPRSQRSHAPQRAPHLGPTLRRHLRRRLGRPLVVSLVAFTLAVLLADLVTFSDLVVNRGFGFGEVGLIAALRLLPVVGVTIPFAILAAALATLARMLAQSEVLALQTSGISPLQLVRPLMGFALLPGLVALALSLEGAPRTNRALNAALASAARDRPAAALESGAVASLGGWHLHAREVSPDGERLRAVAAWMPSLGETVFARRANLVRDGGTAARVVLEDGVALLGEDGSASLVRFGRLAQEIAAPQPEPDAIDSTATAGVSELLAEARSTADVQRRREVAAELHRRVALPAATPLFAMLAVPLVLRQRARSRSSGVLIGLAITVAYYALVQLGEGLARGGQLPVAAAAWLPNAVLLAVALVGIARVVRAREGPGFTARVSELRARMRRRRSRARRFMLDRHVLVLFAELTLAGVAGLLLASLVVDVLDNLKWFTKYASTADEVLRYYAARVPILASRVLPLALLASAALSMSLLASNGELVGMRACGISPARTVAPLLLACVVIAGFYHVLANQWVPRASALASRIKQTEIKDRSLVRRGVWLRSSNSLFEIETLDPLRGLAVGVTLYELDADGMPTSRTDSPSARHLGDGVWELAQPVRYEVTPDGLEPRTAVHYAELGDELPAEVETGDLSLAELRERIREAEADGYDPRRFQVDLHQRLAAPLACIVLPALVLLFAGAGPPFPTVGGVLVWGFAVALVHGLLTALGGALGYGGALPPALAGWGPIATVSALGGWLGRRVQERASRR